MFRRAIWITFLLLIAGFMATVQVGAQSENRLIFVLNAEGALTPSMAEYLQRGIRQATAQGAQALIFQINTPGGELELMNRMVSIITASQVPVVVYVAPSGAIAGSAGTLITLAGHAAAMAPGTAIGAASPISGSGEDLTQTLERKQKEILKASARELAQRRGQEAVQIAEATIEDARAASATEALQANLIDFIAVDLADLVQQLDGFQVTVQGQERALETSGSILVPLPQSFIERLLGLLTNPNVVALLLNLGVVAILIEISSPGGWVAGFIGAVCLALAGYGMGILSVNWFGILFLVIAFVLFILDIKAPTHGALTAAGIGSLIVASLVLFNSPNVPSFQRVSVPLVVVSAMITGGLFALVVALGVRAQKSPVRTGMESMVGRKGKAGSDLPPAGWVLIGGEQWSANLAEGEETVRKGDRIEVTEVEGLHLRVRKAP
jgi:membrane-bound serine protease (ClpP class)